LDCCSTQPGVTNAPEWPNPLDSPLRLGLLLHAHAPPAAAPLCSRRLPLRRRSLHLELPLSRTAGLWTPSLALARLPSSVPAQSNAFRVETGIGVVVPCLRGVHHSTTARSPSSSSVAPRSSLVPPEINDARVVLLCHTPSEVRGRRRRKVVRGLTREDHAAVPQPVCCSLRSRASAWPPRCYWLRRGLSAAPQTRAAGHLRCHQHIVAGVCAALAPVCRSLSTTPLAAALLATMETAWALPVCPKSDQAPPPCASAPAAPVPSGSRARPGACAAPAPTPCTHVHAAHRPSPGRQLVDRVCPCFALLLA
jgi:hypothetical protein